MTRDLAVALVQAFVADASVKQISNDLLDELWALAYVNREWRVQAWLSRVAKPAADMCWDKKYKSAVKYLCTHPLERENHRYENEALTSAHKYEKRYEADRKAVDDLYASYRRSNQWGVCK